jgi:hypothetical protein
MVRVHQPHSRSIWTNLQAAQGQIGKPVRKQRIWPSGAVTMTVLPWLIVTTGGLTLMLTGMRTSQFSRFHHYAVIAAGCAAAATQ